MSRLYPVSFLAVLLTSVFPAGAPGGEPEVLKRWDFDSPQGAEGWTVGAGLKNPHVEAGKLRMEITAADAFIFAPPLRAPLDGCAVRVRLRCDHDGSTQVYWKSEPAPPDGHTGYGQFATVSRSLQGCAAEEIGTADKGFVTVDFPIGSPADVGRELTGFRIDPFNGNTSGIVEFDWVEVVRLPMVLDALFSAASHRAGIADQTAMRLKLRQVAGRAAGTALTVKMPGGDGEAVSMPPGRPVNVERRCRLDRPGAHRPRVEVRDADGRPVFDLETSTIACDAASFPVIAGLRTDRTRLDLVPTPDGKNVGAARWQIAAGTSGGGGSTEWRDAGWLLPLAHLMIERQDGCVVSREPAMTVVEHDERKVRLAATIDEAALWRVELELAIVEKAGRESVDIRVKLSGPGGGRLLDFAGPVLRVEPGADPLNRYALFGGLEFLEPGWPSSSDRAVGKQFADRWTPHPFKVTLPVMAVESAGVTSALMWQPLDPWDDAESMPAATFASPNSLDDQSNHLMKLSVPTIPRWREENESIARRPCLMRDGQPVSLRYKLFGEAGLPVAMAARRWYEIYGPPPPPPPTHDHAALYDLLARHWGETMYWPAEKGWRYHWYLDQKSSFIGWMLAELIAHAVETGKTERVERVGLQKKTIIEAAGPLSNRLKHDGGARAQIAAMQPDGTWPFRNTDELRQKVREITGGKYDSLGEDGSTSLGTCVQPALAILRCAELRGDEDCISAGLKALEAMKRFRVPRGAQVWEVHQDIPDIRAAALAVEAYQIGYHLTGDTGYLEAASYWAWTGVPFAYSWHVPIEGNTGSMTASRDRDDWQRFSMPLAEGFLNPHRQVAPYATVPVLGPTFYVVNWFGVIVQWCGLEWAWKTIELCEDRPEPLLRYIADGVVASGLQQMFDRPPWVGLYPDVWDTQENRACGAFICANLPMQCLRAQGHIPSGSKTWTRVLRDESGKRRWHVSGWGTPVKLDPPRGPGIWNATLAFPAGQPNELVLANVDPPRHVRVAGRLLQTREPAGGKPASAGWFHDAQQRALVIHFEQAEPHTEIRIDW